MEIVIKASQCGKSLVVNKINEEHNHEINEASDIVITIFEFNCNLTTTLSLTYYKQRDKTSHLKAGKK